MNFTKEELETLLTCALIALIDFNVDGLPEVTDWENEILEISDKLEVYLREES